MNHRERVVLPPKLADETHRIHLLSDRKLLTKIDDWRKGHEWPPTRSDAIRILVEAGIEALNAADGDKPAKPKRGK